MHTALRLITALPALVLTGATVPAHAAPTHPQDPNDVFVVQCPIGQVALQSPPNDADFPPGFVVGTHQLFVPYSFDFTLTVDGVPSQESYAKKAPVPADAMTCTVDETFVVDGVTYVFTGAVVAALRGRP